MCRIDAVRSLFFTASAALVFVLAGARCQTVERVSFGPPAAPEEGTDETEQEEVAPLVRLEATGTTFRPAPVPHKTTGSGLRCGIDEGVIVTKGPSGVRYRPLPHVDAAFAVRLAKFEELVQEAAGVWMNSRVVRIEHLGTYACRNIAGGGSLSEHARGNAIDVATFVFANGRKVSVKKDWAEGEPRRGAEQFLRDLVTRMREEGTFGVVLTPDWDARHHDHLHLDGSRRSMWRWLFS